MYKHASKSISLPCTRNSFMNNALSFLERTLPSSLIYLLHSHPHLQELRMSIDAPIVVVSADGRKTSHLICTHDLLTETLNRLCEHSYYSHADTIKEGFLSLDHGIRVGLCGRAVCHGEELTTVKDITFLCIRIPGHIKGVAMPLFLKMKEHRFSRGTLLYSPPGVGKTTVLKDLAFLLSREGLHIAVIDTRGELSCALKGVPASVYLYYPKALALAMAVRTVTPDLILLDEIGAEECKEIFTQAPAGVPIVASAHGRSLSEILNKEEFECLIKQGIFSLFAGLERVGKTARFRFDTLEEIARYKEKH